MSNKYWLLVLILCLIPLAGRADESSMSADKAVGVTAAFSGVVPMSSEEWQFIPGKVEEEKTFGDYKVLIEWDKDEAEQRLKISKKGLLLFIKEGHRFEIGPSLEVDEKVRKEFPIGKDITGDGQPELLVSEWSGGAHCCFSTDIFTIGDNFKSLASIDEGHGSGEFKDIDKDGAYELLVNDWTFAYWNTCFSSSPAPEVVLKLKNGQYQPDMALMRQPDLTEKEEKKIIKAVERDRKTDTKTMNRENKKEFFDSQNYGWFRDGFYLPPVAWDHILWLIYTGNGLKAKDFLGKVWPLGKPGQDVFWSEFMEKLSDSPYCYAIKEYYGDRLPIVCNKQSDDLGSAGFGEILKRGYYQELFKKDADKENAKDGKNKDGKPCEMDSGDCS